MRKIISAFLITCLVTVMFQFQPAKAQAETNYNYGEALQKAVMFYEFQRSGALPENTRNNWRGDSGLNDGADAGLDLTGGWYDAGDHVKFNLPMSYSAAMLAWSVYESKDALQSSGQLDYLLDNIKWATDYLIKCHPSANVFYYQVGSGSADHSWWGPAEVMQMERPSYKVDLSSPGSSVSAEAAAALAAAGAVFADSNPTYSATCIKHAKELFAFADTTKSDSGYTAASGYYNSYSGFYDELSWAGVWLYMATGEETYLNKAESYVANWGTEPQSTTISYKWAQNWDDVHYGAAILLARITNKAIYKTSTEMHLDYWTTGYNGNRITYTPKGLAWLDTWGSLRYATTTAFLASVYADWSGCTASKVATYKAFAKQQVDYALGSTGRSFVVGYGTNSPTRPHHRTAHSSWADSQTVPNYHRHTIYGALVGGPGSDDSYTDDISNYTNNEIACDYNAGFVGALAKLYGEYGGEPIANFTAMEPVTNDEFFVQAGINASGRNFMEIKAVINNQTGWPARVCDKLSFKYFIDISEAVKLGYTAADFTVKTNYNDGSKVSQLLPWDEANNIYYVNVDFTGTKIYPGGQSAYKKEVQFRISAPENTSFWDNSNDYSFTDITGVSSGNVVKTAYIPVYDAGVKVFGNEPGASKDSASISPVTAAFDKYKPSDIEVTVNDNGNTLTAIKNGSTILTKGTDYTVDGDKINIKASYLTGLTVGTAALTFDFNAGIDPKLTVTIKDSTPSGAISISQAEFDKYNPKDIAVTVTLNGHTLDGIKNGSTVLTKGTDYTVDGDKITIKSSYLSGLAVGTAALTFDFNAGIDPKLTVTIKDSTPSGAISISQAEFDKNSPKDIAVAITLNGHTLEGIKNGNTVLTEGTDYTVEGDTVTILSSYLATQSLGKLKLVFDFSSGTDPELVITVKDSSIVISGELKIQMYNANKEASINGISPKFKIVNTGTEAISLSEVKLRYYYTINDEKAQNFWCDWSSAGTGNVTGTFVKLPEAKTSTDYYLEIGFTDAAGTLAAGQSVEVQTRFSKTDWTNYTQTDDYSFDKTDNNYTDNQKVTGYLAGSLVWGIEP